MVSSALHAEERLGDKETRLKRHERDEAELKETVRAIRKHIQNFKPVDSTAWRIVISTILQLLIAQYVLVCFAIPELNYVSSILAHGTWVGFCLHAGVVGYIGLLVLRLFIIYHDCVHNSYYSTTAMNAKVGKFLSFWLMTPVHTWNHYHSQHHHHFGNTDIFDTGQTILWSKREWESFPLWKRAIFRAFREPIVFHVVYPPLKFFFEYPVVYGDLVASLGLAYHILFALLFGYGYAAGFTIGAVIGVVLFHFQHSVNSGFREPKSKWSFDKAGLLGSTHQLIPFPLSVYTMGIEFHHIHHLSTKVPGYRLAECHNKGPASFWKSWVTQVGFVSMCTSFFNTLYDEETDTFVPFSYSIF